MSISLADQAVKFLVERGWPMLPSRGLQKKPCVGWKEYQTRRPTAGQIQDWSRKFNPDRWGLVTGELAGIVVIDFDGDDGRKLMQKLGVKPHVRTGSGGFHWYLRHPGWRVPTLNAKTSKGSWPWKGLDVRGDGGFAVLLGCNENGAYVQLRELALNPFEALPEEIRTFLRNNAASGAPPSKAYTPALPIRTGAGHRPVTPEALMRKAREVASNSGRNNAGFWLACQLRDNSFSFADAEATMRAYQSTAASTNTKGQRESYTAREALASLQQAYTRHAREPWKNPGSVRIRASLGAPQPPNPDQRGKGDVAIRTPQTPQVPAAEKSGSIDIYVGHTGEPLVGHMGEPLSRNHYARVPREVSADRRLKPRDVRVYAVLAAFCWQGSTAQVGKRLISKLACCAERLVIDSLKRLEATGHIKKQTGRRGKRGRYILTSSVFAQKQRAGVEEIVSGPGGRPRLASVRKDQGKAWNSHSAPLKRSARVKDRR